MYLFESLYEIKPIPEVEEAVYDLLTGHRGGIAVFGGDSWWEDEEGNRLDLTDMEDNPDDSITETTDPESSQTNLNEEYVEWDIKMHITGMPILTLRYYRQSHGAWSTELTIEIPAVSETDDSFSLLSLFLQSRYAPLFREDDSSSEIIRKKIIIDREIDAAIRLISYYIRYYGYQDKLEDHIGLSVD